MSKAPTREPVHLRDYAPPAYVARDVHLRFELDPDATVVTATQRIVRNPEAAGGGPDELALFGEDQELLDLRLDGSPVSADRRRLEDDRLVLPGPLPDAFELTVASRHAPAANKRLMGLYTSNGVYCTQCEAEGFRRIAYFQDRPDVMARYRVRVEADRKACPVLLSNGNLLETGELPGGRRHWALWEDPPARRCRSAAGRAGSSPPPGPGPAAPGAASAGSWSCARWRRAPPRRRARRARARP
jgi:aminopeptidase N